MGPESHRFFSDENPPRMMLCSASKGDLKTRFVLLTFRTADYLLVLTNHHHALKIHMPTLVIGVEYGAERARMAVLVAYYRYR